MQSMSARHMHEASTSQPHERTSSRSINNDTTRRESAPIVKYAENGRLRQVGDWRLEKSSSGKSYYYNTVTNTSQWEKPLLWNDVERKLAKEQAVRSNGRPSSRSGAYMSKICNKTSKKAGDQMKASHSTTTHASSQRSRPSSSHSTPLAKRPKTDLNGSSVKVTQVSTPNTPAIDQENMSAMLNDLQQLVQQITGPEEDEVKTSDAPLVNGVVQSERQRNRSGGASQGSASSRPDTSSDHMSLDEDVSELIPPPPQPPPSMLSDSTATAPDTSTSRTTNGAPLTIDTKPPNESSNAPQSSDSDRFLTYTKHFQEESYARMTPAGSDEHWQNLQAEVRWPYKRSEDRDARSVFRDGYDTMVSQLTKAREEAESSATMIECDVKLSHALRAITSLRTARISVCIASLQKQRETLENMSDPLSSSAMDSASAAGTSLTPPR